MSHLLRPAHWHRFAELEEAANANQAALLASLEAEEQCAAAAKTKKAHRGKKKKKGPKSSAAAGSSTAAEPYADQQDGAEPCGAGIAERGDSAQDGSSDRALGDVEAATERLPAISPGAVCDFAVVDAVRSHVTPFPGLHFLDMLKRSQRKYV